MKRIHQNNFFDVKSRKREIATNPRDERR